MSEIVISTARLPTMSVEAIDRVRRVTEADRKLPQIQFVTQHILHAGMYLRTVMLPAGSRGTGVLVKIPTVLILHGDADVYTGYDIIRVTGYAVLPAAAGRKQAFNVYSDLTMTMMFPTNVKTVAEAEAHFTDEVDLLCPLSEIDRHQFVVTGE